MSLLDISQEMKNRIALTIVKDEARDIEQRLKALAEIKLLVLENKSDKGLISVEQDQHYLLYGALNNHDFDTQFKTDETQGERLVDFYELVDYLYQANNDDTEKYPTDVFLVDEKHIGLNLPTELYLQAYDVVDPLNVVNINDTNVCEKVKNAINENLPKDNQLIDKITVYLDYRLSQKPTVSYHIVFGRHTNMLKDIITPILNAITDALVSSDDLTRVDKDTLNIACSDFYMVNEPDVNQTPVYQNSQLKLPDLPLLNEDEIADNYFALGVISKDDTILKTIYDQLKGLNVLITTTLTNNPQVSNGDFKVNDHMHFVDTLKDKHGFADLYITNEAFDHYAIKQSARFGRNKINWQDLVAISFKAEQSDEANNYTFILHDDRNQTIKLGARFIIDLYTRFEDKTPLINLNGTTKYQDIAEAIKECCIASPKLSALTVLYEYDNQAGTLYFVTKGEFDDTAFAKLTQQYNAIIKKFDLVDVFSDLQFLENINYFSERKIDITPFYQKRKKLFGLF